MKYKLVARIKNFGTYRQEVEASDVEEAIILFRDELENAGRTVERVSEDIFRNNTPEEIAAMEEET